MRHRAMGAALVLVVSGMSLVACSGSSATKAGPNAPTSTGKSGFGSLESVCGPAESENVDTGTPGITKDSIAITTISDAGSSIQRGLNQELWDASDVFVAWCNDNGGIHGRKIVLSKGDAQVTLYEQVIENACDQAFALVGGGGALDYTGQEARLECLLPDFPGFQASSQSRSSALSYPAVATPLSERTVGVLRLLKSNFAPAEQRLGFIYGNFDSVKMIKAQIERFMADDGGWPDKPLYQETYNVAGATNWQHYAQKIKELGITSLVFEGQPKDLAELVIALHSIEYTGLKWIFSDSNMYDQSVIANAGAALDSVPVFVPVYIYPFEEAGQPDGSSAALDKYLDLFDEYLPDGKARALLGVNSFASWLLFAKAAGACGAQLTRACLVEQMSSITSFDAGGLTSERDPSNISQASKCFTAVKASSQGWVIWDAVDKNQGVFNCSDDNRYTMNIDQPFNGQPAFTDKYPRGPSLGDVGKGIDDLQ